MHYTPDLSVIVKHWDVILYGLRLTILVALMSMALALVIGFVVAMVRMSPWRVVRWIWP